MSKKFAVRIVLAALGLSLLLLTACASTSNESSANEKGDWETAHVDTHTDR